VQVAQADRAEVPQDVMSAAQQDQVAQFGLAGMATEDKTAAIYARGH
jgi:hypothetical protein